MNFPTAEPIQHRDPDRLRRIWIYGALAVLSWAVFGQTLRHDFIAYDDQNYVYENPQITAGLTVHGVIGAFAHAHARNWHPVTTISHMLDCQLFGLNPAGHHLINVLLHTANVLLLLSVLYGMTGATWRSVFIAAVFAIHPLRAESVAWIAERKDVLSGLFFMLTLVAYLNYARGPSIARYLWVLLALAFGLMSKPTLVPLPLLLLCLDYWPLRRFRRSKDGASIRPLVLEKLPLLFLSGLCSGATLFVQHTTIDYSNQLSFAARMSNAVIACVVYVQQLIWPAKLAVFYPHASSYASPAEIFIAFAFVGLTTAAAIGFRRRLPYFVTGWFWFLIALAPVIGLIQVGIQGHSDRYTYLSEIGLTIAITWAGAELFSRSRLRRELVTGIAFVIVLVLATAGWRQTATWRNTEALWTQALAVGPTNEVAHYNIAEIFRGRGDFLAAIENYQAALKQAEGKKNKYCQLDPAIVHNALGNALTENGNYRDALAHYRSAIALEPDLADAHANIASLLARGGEFPEAISEYEIALTIPPEDAVNHVRVGELLLQTGHSEIAINHYRRALEIAPGSRDVRAAFARALATKGIF